MPRVLKLTRNFRMMIVTRPFNKSLLLSWPQMENLSLTIHGPRHAISGHVSAGAKMEKLRSVAAAMVSKSELLIPITLILRTITSILWPKLLDSPTAVRSSKTINETIPRVML